MHFSKIIILSLSAALAAACGGSADQSGGARSGKVILTAATLGEQTILSNAEYRASARYAGADIGLGERLALQCRACHSLEAGGADMIGPALYGVIGRAAGSRSGFDYSPALAAGRFVWTLRSLDAWLTAPARFLPGNRMVYAGLANAADRDAVIAYLLNVTDDTPGE